MTNGNFNTTSSSGRYLTLNWNRTGYSIPNNTSTLHWEIKGAGNSGYVICGNFKVLINGTQVYYSSTRINVYNNTIIASGDITISHNADGSKTVDMYAEAGIYATAVNCRGSGSFQLDSIVRYPAVTINSTSRTLNTINLNLGYSIAVPEKYHIYNGNTFIGEFNSSNIKLTGLTPNVTYNLKACGYANGGWGSFSNIVSVTTLDISKITSANNFTDESSPQINFSNPSGTRIDAWLEIGGDVTQRLLRTNIPNTGSYIWSLSSDERNLLLSLTQNTSSINARYVIKTDNNSTYLNWIDKTLSIVNANPIFADFTYRDINLISVALTGNNQNIIKGVSNIEFTIPVMQAIKNAIGKTYNCFSGNEYINTNYSTLVQTIVLNNAKSGTLSVQAVDSRGNSTTVNKSATLIEWSKPIISNQKTVRNNNVDQQTQISANGSYINWTGLLVDNDITRARYRYRKQGETTWSSYLTIALTNVVRNNGTWSIANISINGDLGANGFDIKNTYEIELEVKDKIDFQLFYSLLNSAKPLLWKDRLNKWVGVSKKPTCALDVSGEILAENNITTQGKFIMSSGNEVLDYDIIDEW